MVALAGMSNLPSRDAVLASDNPVVIMAAGDIAEGGTSTMANAAATGDLVRDANPDYVVPLGDNAYPDGSPTDYATKYDPTWGSFKARTHPTPGNHEYHSDPPAGYLGYFGKAEVTNADDGGVYYAWNVGNGWRAYSLNATGSVSTGAGSAQEKWLQADLAAHPGMHVLAYLHFPRYNSGTIHGEDTSQCPLWTDLLAARADLVLAGHEHSYERWTKQDCSGNATASGIREFKVGSGGNELYPFGAQPAHLQARNNTDFGVLRLTLHDTSYDWAFLGSGRCWDGSTSVDCAAHKGTVLDSGSAATNVLAPTTAPVPTTPPPTTPLPTPTLTTAPTSPVTPPVTSSPPSPPVTAPTGTATTLHYTANEGGAFAAPTAIGFDLHDTGMSAATVDALPAGTKAMVWAGNGKCPTSLTDAFRSFVSARADDPKVYGYYLVDEPDDPASRCVDGIRAMADYVHTQAPGQKAFIVLTDYPGTYAAYAPANSHADLVGLDPYPCKRDSSTCDYAEIDRQVTAAVGAGVPRGAIVPTFQLFGDSTWRPPTTSELGAILARWQEDVPSPVMDYSYSWSCQGGSLTDCLATRPDWQTAMKAYFAGSVTLPTPTPEPTPEPTPGPTPTSSPGPTPATPTSLSCPVVASPFTGETVVCTFR